MYEQLKQLYKENPRLVHALVLFSVGLGMVAMGGFLL